MSRKERAELCKCGHALSVHGFYGHCWHWVDLHRGITCTCDAPAVITTDPQEVTR